MALVRLLRSLATHWRVPAAFLVPLLCLPLPLSIWPTQEIFQSGKGAYILLVTSVFLVFEILPIALTVMLSIVLMPVIGVATIPQVSQAFVNDTYFLFIACLTIAISIETTRMHNRIALLTLRRIGTSPSRLILGFTVISGGLSMWMANTAVTVMILPIALAVSDTLAAPAEPAATTEEIGLGTAVERHLESASERQKFLENDSTAIEVEDDASAEDVAVTRPEMLHKDTSLSKGLQLAVAFAANIGGCATLIGSHPNILFRMTLEKYYGTETGLNFVTYFFICGPVAVCALLITWFCLCALFVPGWLRRGSNNGSTDNLLRRKARAVMDDKLKELGPMRQEEISVLVIFLCLLVLWLSRNPQFAPGWGSLFRPGYATDSVPALFAAILLFVWPADFCQLAEGGYRPLLTWKDLNAKMPWDLLLFACGLAAVTHVAEVSGLTSAIGNQVPSFTGLPSWVVVALICVVASVLTEFSNNSVITAIFVPVLANVAEDAQVNPIYYMLAATLASMFSFMVPISSFATIIVYGHGTVTMWDMMKAGLGPKVACLTFLIISLEFFGWLVFDVKTFPAWAQVRYSIRTNSTVNGTYAG